MSPRVLASVLLAFASVTACRTGGNADAQLLDEVVSEDDPCATHAAPRSPEGIRFGRELLACVNRTFQLAPLTPPQEQALQEVFDGFNSSGCGGCHIGRSSYGGLANFVSNDQAGPEEFYRGLALRHHLTRTIADRCVADGPGKQELKEVLARRRHLSEAGLDYTVNGRDFPSIAGIPFFTPGTDQEMRSQVLSFLQGGFEIPAEPGDELHERLLAFIAAGARFSARTHACIIRDAAFTLQHARDLRVINP